ncbi:MAG: hypothetical protein ACXVLT_03650 [Flavisolibacter sp.]
MFKPQFSAQKVMTCISTYFDGSHCFSSPDSFVLMSMIRERGPNNIGEIQL